MILGGVEKRSERGEAEMTNEQKLCVRMIPDVKHWKNKFLTP